MKHPRFLILGLLAAALLAGGCATESTRSGKNTYILGGLMTIRKHDFHDVGPAGAQVDMTKWYGHGDPSGNSVSVLWDAVKNTDY